MLKNYTHNNMISLRLSTYHFYICRHGFLQSWWQEKLHSCLWVCPKLSLFLSSVPPFYSSCLFFFCSFGLLSVVAPVVFLGSLLVGLQFIIFVLNDVWAELFNCSVIRKASPITSNLLHHSFQVQPSGRPNKVPLAQKKQHQEILPCFWRNRPQ